jgi:biotin transporter BioY
VGLGGSLLAAIFVSEAYVHGGFLVAFAVGVFVMTSLTARFFGEVRIWVYCLATLGLTVLLLLLGIPR